jgi:peroxiredoxin
MRLYGFNRNSPRICADAADVRRYEYFFPLVSGFFRVPLPLILAFSAWGRLRRLRKEIGMVRRIALLLAGILLISTVNAHAGSLRIGERVPPFQLRNTSGRVVDTASFNGNVVVLYFWTDACGCKEQLLELRRYVAGLRKRPFTFLTVNAGQERQRVTTFVTTHALPYQVLLDEQADVARNRFGVRVLPTILVISRDGVLRERVVGVVETRKLEAIIGRYL